MTLTFVRAMPGGQGMVSEELPKREITPMQHLWRPVRNTSETRGWCNAKRWPLSQVKTVTISLEFKKPGQSWKWPAQSLRRMLKTKKTIALVYDDSAFCALRLEAAANKMNMIQQHDILSDTEASGIQSIPRWIPTEEYQLVKNHSTWSDRSFSSQRFPPVWKSLLWQDMCGWRVIFSQFD